jgi:hypothetical protein
MDAVQLQPHLDYMTDAAHLIHSSSPETAAYLMRSRNELLLQHGAAQSDIQKQHVCNSCGHIMVAGQGSTLKMETAKALRKKQTPNRGEKPKEAERTPSTKALSCGRCNRKTKISVAVPPRTGTKASRAGVPVAAQSFGSTEPARRSDNASSKKRAKNRKAGLQALLTKSQAAHSGASRGLTLADFMKK